MPSSSRRGAAAVANYGGSGYHEGGSGGGRQRGSHRASGQQQAAEPSSNRRRNQGGSGGSGPRSRTSNEHSSDSRSLKPLCAKTRLCAFYEHGACQRGKACTFAHGEAELRSAPDLSLTRLCSKMVTYGRCDRGAECKFAHSEFEIRETQHPRNIREEPGTEKQQPDPSPLDVERLSRALRLDALLDIGGESAAERNFRDGHPFKMAVPSTSAIQPSMSMWDPQAPVSLQAFHEAYCWADPIFQSALAPWRDVLHHEGGGSHLGALAESRSSFAPFPVDVESSPASSGLFDGIPACDAPSGGLLPMRVLPESVHLEASWLDQVLPPVE